MNRRSLKESLRQNEKNFSSFVPMAFSGDMPIKDIAEIVLNGTGADLKTLPIVSVMREMGKRFARREVDSLWLLVRKAHHIRVLETCQIPKTASAHQNDLNPLACLGAVQT